MGCWNETCGFSNLPIKSDDEVMAFILILNKTDHLYIYPNTFASPFALPIIAKYDDYGSIEDAKINFNTKHIISEIKEYFINSKYTTECNDYYVPKDWNNVTIEEIYTLIERGLTVYYGKENKIVFASYLVLKNIYDKMTDLSGLEDLNVYITEPDELNKIKKKLTDTQIEKELYLRFASYCNLLINLRKAWIPMTGKSQDEDYKLHIKLAEVVKDFASTKLQESE